MLDSHKLITLVSHCPALWNRNDKKYSDQEFKTTLWSKIAIEMNTTEKYSQEKNKHYSSNLEFQDFMQFLDLQRELSEPAKRSMVFKADPYTLGDDYEEGPSSESETGSYMSQDSSVYNSLDFSRALIKMVHSSPALWDRSNKDHHDKIAKDQLWQTIARSLKTDVSMCTLRWKGLREKYIRQKQKYNDGLGKWELLDDMAFLDSVILYRKRHWHPEENNMFTSNENSCPPSHPTTSDCDSSAIANFYNNSIFHSQNVPVNFVARPNMPPDSTLDNSSTKRQCINNDSENNGSQTIKQNKLLVRDKEMRSPEQIFGELVAAMLACKPEKDKHIAMTEIMTILARSTSHTT
ncbi:transcription factor Adf-1-like isoform X2 [Agrilus planipennis]|uniref:Transcription factor Adf-1-like isoform X2 n=1 Tax=Agrilus planipennis TaxID=224129 RepID=A0A1W4WRX6_AGRPL|nr:transcription factor Adf-1-like isoform X2 [Agrilus planipennis]